jgi:type II secretory ATPase GspE/PulE/Tfp pilus assembly ATPase PilB-like protein
MSKISTYNQKTQKEEISEAPQVEELLRNLEFHKAIQSITGRISSAETIEEIVVDIKEDIRKLFNIHILTIYLIDKGKKEIFTLERTGNEVKEIRFPMDTSSFAGFVAQRKKLLQITDAYNEREIRKINDALSFDSSLDKIYGVVTGQIIASPIVCDGIVLGVIEIMNKKGGDKIDDYQQIFLDEISGFLAKALYTHLNFALAKQKLGTKFDALIQNGAIAPAQMDKALKEANATKEDIATILMEQYHISKNDIGAALADHFACQFSAYDDELPVPHDLLIGIEKSSLVNMLWVPLKVIKGRIHLIIDDPSDHLRKSKIEEILETNSIQYDVALAADILKFIDRFYSSQENETQVDEEFSEPSPENQFEPENIVLPPTKTDEIIIRPVAKTKQDNGVTSVSQSEVSQQKDVMAEESAKLIDAIELEPEPKPKPKLETHAEDLSGDKTRPQDEQHPVVEKPSLQIADIKNVLKKPAVVIHQSKNNIPQVLTDFIIEVSGRGASAIHFEPDPDTNIVRMRIRIDGQFLTHHTMTYGEYETVMNQLKIAANLNVQNRTIIQNGKLILKRPSGDEIKMRVTFIPTQSPLEDAVIHISSKTRKIPLELLGLSERNYTDLVNILQQPRGLVFIVGPTGAGITTTLHACLENINTPDRKIWTAEEPIEIRQNGLRQVQIDPQKGFDFPKVLRSILNADPDVIMVSQVHDPDTANICMKASINGCLVLSTLRVENILDAIERCLDMGINHLVFADAMLSIMEQRMIKTLCPKCKEKYHPSQEEYEELAETYGKDAFDKLNISYSYNFNLFRPKGCDTCGQTGYSGRMCVSEIFIFTSQIKRMIRRKESPESIYSTAIAQGMTTLLQDGISKVFQGHSDSRHVRLSCLK